MTADQAQTLIDLAGQLLAYNAALFIVGLGCLVFLCINAFGNSG